MARRPASERLAVSSRSLMTVIKKPLTILLASPRGFCAGVDRAIQIVERAIERYGAPVYVRHEIVHNRYVVENLEAKGAIFVEELDEVPDDRAGRVLGPWRAEIGAGRGRPAQSALSRRHLPAGLQGPPRGRAPPASAGRTHHADRPCRPSRGDRHDGPAAARRGDAGRGRRPTREAVMRAPIRPSSPSSPRPRCRSTTRRRSSPRCGAAFPASRARRREDICYATTNRQAAVKAIAADCDLLVVIGAPEFLQFHAPASRSPSAPARQRAAGPARRRDGLGLARRRVRRLGITAGASAPEMLVDELIDGLPRTLRRASRGSRATTEESVVFKLPPPPSPWRDGGLHGSSDEAELDAFLAGYDIGEPRCAFRRASPRAWRTPTTLLTTTTRPIYPHALREARGSARICPCSSA